MMPEQPRQRYPGPHSFGDSALDRKLFFGRTREKKDLLDTVIAERLVVLYARSGVGKTSLLNAGLKEGLREQGFLPLAVRLNDEKQDPIESVFSCIEDAAKTQHIEYKSELGSQSSLWVYFKTLQLWRGDSLLIPVLILDQFEELFTLHDAEARNRFIDQLGALFHGPGAAEANDKRKDGVALSDALPVLKVIIGIREDYLPFLEELAAVIPCVMRTRFRLAPLTRDNARVAILEPAAVSDDELQTSQFVYSGNTVEAVLDLLAETSSASIRGANNTIEPFQLQLICQRVEDLVRERGLLENAAPDGQETESAKPVVTLEDLGGRAGLHKVVEQFYERQLDEASTDISRWRLERLFENGLVSRSGKRLSLQETEITIKFKVPTAKLIEMSRRRVIRAEPRLGSVFYELSHDMLLDPVLAARTRRTRGRRTMGMEVMAAMLVLALVGWFWSQSINKLRDEGTREARLAADLARSNRSLEAALYLAADAAGQELQLPEVDAALSAVMNRTTITSAGLTSAKILAGAFSSDGRNVAIITDAGDLELHDRAGQLLFTRRLTSTSPHPVIAFTPDGDGVAVGNDTTLEAYTVGGSNLFPQQHLPAPVTALAFSPDAKQFIAATQTGLCSILTENAQPQCTAANPDHVGIKQIVFTSNGMDTLTANGNVYNWTVENGGAPRPDADAVAIPNTEMVQSWVTSADGSTFAALVGASLVVWKRGEAPQQIPSFIVKPKPKTDPDLDPALGYLIALSADGSFLAVTDGGSETDVFDMRSDSPFKKYPLPDLVGKSVQALAWSPDPGGYHLAIGGTEGVSLDPLEFTMPSGLLLDNMRRNGAANQTTAQQNGPRQDSGKQSLNIPTKTLKSLRNVVALSFFPDGSLLTGDNAADGDSGPASQVSLWNPDGSFKVTFTRSHEQPSGNVKVLAASHDISNKKFALGDDNTNLEIWSLANLKEAGTSADVPNDIRLIAWNTSDRSIATIDKKQRASEWAATNLKQTSSSKEAVDSLSKEQMDEIITRLMRLGRNDEARRLYMRWSEMRSSATDENSGNFRLLYYDENDALLTGHADGTLAPMRGSDKTAAMHLPDPVTSLDVDSQGRLVVGTRSGFMLYHSGSADTFKVNTYNRNAFTDAPISALAHSVDFARNISVSSTGTVHVFRDTGFYDTADFTIRSGGVRAAAAGSNGKEIMVLGGNNRLYRARIGGLSRIGDAMGDQVEISPRNDFAVVLNTSSKMLSAYDAALKRRLYWWGNIDQACKPTAFKIAPDAKTIAVGCDNGSLAVISATGWDFMDPVKVFSDGDSVTAISYAAGMIAAGTKNGKLATWAGPGAGLSMLQTATKDSASVTCIGLTSDGKTLAAGDDKGTVWLYKIDAGRGAVAAGNIPAPTDDTSAIVSLLFTDGDTRLLKATRGGSLATYRLDGSPVKNGFPVKLGDELGSVKLSPDGRYLATTSRKGYMRVWNRKGQVVSESPEQEDGLDSQARDIAFTADGTSLLFSSMDTLDRLHPITALDWLDTACRRLSFSTFDTPGADLTALPSDQREKVAKAMPSARKVCTKLSQDRGRGEPDVGLVENDGAAHGFFATIASWFHGRRSDSPLLQAARAGDLQSVLSVTGHGADLNTKDDAGRTALLIALRGGYGDIATVLLARGADAKVTSEDGEGALHAAATGGLTTMMRRLLDRGLPVDARDADGLTPLMIAAWRGDVAGVQMLLDRHASVNARDVFGRTALMTAVRFYERDSAALAKRNALVKLLQSYHADPNVQIAQVFGFAPTPYSLAKNRAMDDDILKWLDAMPADSTPDGDTGASGIDWRLDPRVFPVELQTLASRLAECTNGSLDDAQKPALFQQISVASQQDQSARVLLGLAYGWGCGTGVDQPAARQAFQQCADSGNGLGQAAYGIALLLGEGGPQDKKKGNSYVAQSSQAGNPFGLYAQANLLPDAEMAKAITLDEDAASRFAPAANSLSLFRKPNSISLEDDPDARQAKEMGDSQPMRRKGDKAFTKRDFTAAARFYKDGLAMKSQMIAWPRFNRIPAQFNTSLAKIDRFGLGTQASDTQAAAYLNHTLEFSDTSFELAWMYEHGQGVPRSHAQALRLYRQSNALGNYSANARLMSFNEGP